MDVSTLTEFLEEHNVEYREHGDHHHCSEGWVQLDCSQCSPNSGHFRLGINLNTLGCSCYVCGRQNAGEALGVILDMPSKVVWGKLGAVIRQLTTAKKRGKLKLPSGVGPLLGAHERYLRGRGFAPEEVAPLWGLLGTSQMSSLPWRIIFPILHNGEVVSWSSRQLHDRGIRYQSARPDEESMNGKTLLYGEQFIGNACIVVEGLLDAIRIGPGAVATMSLTVTPEQVRGISKVYRRVVAFDNEDDAQRRAAKLCRQLALFPGETLCVRLDSHDPGEATDEEIDHLRSFLK